MNSELVRHRSPAEQEIAKKRQELAILQAELTDRELFLESLRAEIAAFQGRYLREVGVLYAELDEWNAKIAELAAEAVGTEQAQSAAAEARARAEGSFAASHGEAAMATVFSPSPALRKLRREVLNEIHPDRASNEVDRLLRERLSKEANVAYLLEDADALRKILEEYRCSPEAVKGEGAPADLERVNRQIRRISKRLAQIDTELADLTSSEIALLMAKVEIAGAKGRNLLDDMAKDIQRRIGVARAEFHSTIERAGR
jgi:DNA repair exonuclease SbcCD ATPase subunit